ncbi:hypothetical protein MUBE_03575 [Mycobacterium uberis]|uniref:Transmembrane protein n=1 Tax=Mycobacterium uberis TaxID=2162698 RepID=A0A3E1HKG0_9MYCO|nr:hypothetical protein [Mycobacterium uberis]RFD26857.1 hypothetical protein MUBE_03575 [Mycobacterium uberis]
MRTPHRLLSTVRYDRQWILSLAVIIVSVVYSGTTANTFFCPPWSGVVWFCFMWGVVVWVVVWVDGLCELIYCVDVPVAMNPSVKRVVL